MHRIHHKHGDMHAQTNRTHTKTNAYIHTCMHTRMYASHRPTAQHITSHHNYKPIRAYIA